MEEKKETITLENLPEKLLEIEKVLKPIGVNLSTDYKINMKQRKDIINIKSVSVTLFLDGTEWSI